MPTPVRFEKVPETEIAKIPGIPVMREFKATYPKRSLAGVVEARGALAGWQKAQPVPVAPKNPTIKVAAVELTAVRLAKLRTIVEGGVSPAAILSEGMDPETFFGTVYSALVAHELMKMEAEYRRRKRVPRLAVTADAEWRQALKAASTAMAAAGLTGLTEGRLLRSISVIQANSKDLNAVLTLANSGVGGATATLTAATVLTASFVPFVASIADPLTAALPIPDLCSQPLAQGSWTKHISKGFSISWTITTWCPTWTDWFRTCQKTYTVFGASFALDLNVGYKVTCCGATAWGQAAAQGCATIWNIKICANCTATVTGVAGVSRTPVANGCNYGIGLVASLKCTFAGQTVLFVSYSFGYVVNAPCPPPGFCP